jgi:hypothetical protein
VLCTTDLFHSLHAACITAYARASNDCGIVMHRALAVLRLMIRSIFVLCCTGRSRLVTFEYPAGQTPAASYESFRELKNMSLPMTSTPARI